MLFNEVSFAGYIDKAPETYASASTGKRVITLHCVLVDEARGAGTQEQIHNVKVKVFERLADLALSVKKGDNVIIKGKLQENKWKDKNTGIEKGYLEIVAFQLGVIPNDQAEKKSPIGKGHAFLDQVPEDLPF